MKVQVKDPDDGFSDLLKRILNSKEVENLVTQESEAKSDQIKEDSIDAFKIRQLEQKQELLVGLTNLLFKKFEELHPSKKYSKFEFTDLSWYKKLGTV
ncbi:MAG: hypothetical protein OEQ12_02220 [Nitrosopumilus sp.]|nr:hypothetical protein [Nitrosopumilus sp.]